VLALLPHVNPQPLAFLYLSQIPYTGLDLGPTGTAIYWVALIGWSLALAYLILFAIVPSIKRHARDFGSRVASVLNSVPEAIPVADFAALTSARESRTFQNEKAAPETSRRYSSYDGFKSFSRNNALSIEDIVKGLSRERSAIIAERRAGASPNVEPVYENVEPIYENVEPIASDITNNTDETGASTRGFVTALIEGDRTAVFAGLRQHVRGGGSPEQFINNAVCLLDDIYRSRIDGTVSEANLTRMTARFSTPVLEKVIASLATAIDSSYSSDITGAKLAISRALSALGA